MKKFILFFFGIVVVAAITSCSTFNNEESKTCISSVNESKTVLALKEYNLKLMASCQQTRGRKLCTALADIVGAVEGVDRGKTLAGVVGVATGGTGFWAVVAGTALIFGASASYISYKNYTCAYAINASELFDFTKDAVVNKIAFVKNDSLLDVKDSLVDDPLTASVENGVELPSDFSYIRTLGINHNAILSAANVVGKLPETSEVEANVMKPMELAPEDYAKFNDAMNSEELKQVFEVDSNNIGQINCLDNLQNCSERVKQALQGYLDLFEIYPDNADDVAEIANGYIKIIEENNEFTAEEKELIYSAIMVSVYSPQFWAEIE